MIIVEGPDNVGKTTLIHRLMELDSNLKLLKRKRFRPDRGESIGSSYIQLLIPSDGDFVNHGYSIADRLLASECIYGDLFRDGCRMTPMEHETIHVLLDLYEAIVIHCDIPDDKLVETWGDRKQMYDDPLKIAHAYRERIHQIFRRPVYRYDWTAPNAHENLHHLVTVHSYIQDEIRRQRDRFSAKFNEILSTLEVVR